MNEYDSNVFNLKCFFSVSKDNKGMLSTNVLSKLFMSDGIEYRIHNFALSVFVFCAGFKKGYA